MQFARDNFASDHGVFDLINIDSEASFSYVNGSLQIDKSSATGGSWDKTGIVEKAPRLLQIGDRYVIELGLLTYSNLGAANADSTFMKIGLQLDKDAALEREYYGLYIESVPKYDNGGGTSSSQSPIVINDRYLLVLDVQADSSLAVWFYPKGDAPIFVGNAASPLINRSARLCVNVYSKDKVRLYDYRATDLSGA